MKIKISVIVTILILILNGCNSLDNNKDDTKIENIIWKLKRYGLTNESLDSIPNNITSTLLFNKINEKIEVKMPCNSFKSSYTITENKINIGSIATTEISCSKELENIDSFIINNLENIQRFETNNSNLYLYSTKFGMLEYSKKVEKKILTEANGFNLTNNKNIEVLKSQNEYSEKLLEYSTKTAEVLDFTQANVILIDAGERPNSGYSFSIKDISQNTKSVTLNIVYEKSGKNCTTNTVISNPYKFIWIKSKKELLISEKIEIKDCN